MDKEQCGEVVHQKSSDIPWCITSCHVDPFLIAFALLIVAHGWARADEVAVAIDVVNARG